VKGLAIVGGILLLLLLLLLSNVRLHVSFSQGQGKVSLHYLFLRFRLFPSKEKKGKEKPKKAAKEQEEAPPEEKPRKKSLSQRLEGIRHFIGSSGKAFQQMRRHIIFYKLQGHITVSREDAHQTALAYARFALFLQALLEIVDSLFVLKMHKLTVSPDFTRERSTYDISFRIRFRPLFLLTAGGRLLLALLWGASGGSQKSVSKGGSYESAASHR